MQQLPYSEIKAVKAAGPFSFYDSMENQVTYFPQKDMWIVACAVQVRFFGSDPGAGFREYLVSII